MKLEKSAEKLAGLTESPSFIHFDIIGFLRLAERNHLSVIDALFSKTGEQGGNLAIPAYSYSYTEKEDYDVLNSKSLLGKTSEFIRTSNPEKRTYDPIFSYITFGNKFDSKYFKPKDYETFGADSLIADSFNSDGKLLSVGNKMHFSTEIHYIEKLLNVPYRYNKQFSGQTIDLNGLPHSTTCNYFCRDLEYAQRNNLTVSFEKLIADLKEEKIIETIELCDEVILESLTFNELHDFIKKKIKNNPIYLMKNAEL